MRKVMTDEQHLIRAGWNAGPGLMQRPGEAGGLARRDTASARRMGCRVQPAARQTDQGERGKRPVRAELLVAARQGPMPADGRGAWRSLRLRDLGNCFVPPRSRSGSQPTGWKRSPSPWMFIKAEVERRPARRAWWSSVAKLWGCASAFPGERSSHPWLADAPRSLPAVVIGRLVMLRAVGG